jgi:hypothetical protein
LGHEGRVNHRPPRDQEPLDQRELADLMGGLELAHRFLTDDPEVNPNPNPEVGQQESGRCSSSSRFWVRSHAPSIHSYRGTKVVWPDFQPMRVPEESVCLDLFR